MSSRALTWALEQEGIPPGAKIVLIAMADAAGPTGKAYASIKTVMRITGHAKEETITAAQKKLEEADLISDTGKRTGSTGKVKVWQLPPLACVEQPPASDLAKFRNTTTNGVLKHPGNTPPNTPVIPRFTETPIYTEHGTGSGKRPQAPTISEMLEYGKVIALPEKEIEACRDHYVANGWKVGKVAMKDWQAVMRNWKRGWIKSNPPKRDPMKDTFRVGRDTL